MTRSLIASVRDLPRRYKLALLIAFDIVALCFALWASFSLRFGEWNPPRNLDEYFILISGPLVAIPIFIIMGIYRGVIRFLPERALWRILQATTIATVCWVVMVFLSQMTGRFVVPRSVPVLYWAIATMLIGSSRFLAKKVLLAGDPATQKDKTIIVYGAGQAGAQLVNALRREGSWRIVGFLDDNTALQGREVAGVKVWPPAQVGTLVDLYGVKQAILSAPSVTSHRRQEIFAALSNAGLRVRTVPPLSELVSGKYLVSQIREIDIDELLGRSSVPADQSLLDGMIRGRTIMVTGAGGSIGSELCRLIMKWEPRRLVLFESSEFALYQIERELRAVENSPIEAVLASITERVSVEEAISRFRVETVFHAAAYKHVPLVEANVLEGIRNNVFGTQTVAAAAREGGVRNFVLISSDKAVRPTNVMGATKRWAELIISRQAQEAAAQGTGQLFCAVRFGNVLGSNGSVVPLFKEQIARGGPVTLTDAAMTRYFMSIHEAAELIVQAGALSKGGDVFLLDMGKPVLIKDLAENMVTLAGLTVRQADSPIGDIEIVVTGKRPGEKMYEELFYDESTAQTTRHPKIMRAGSDHVDGRDVVGVLDELSVALSQRDEARARQVLFEVIN